MLVNCAAQSFSELFDDLQRGHSVRIFVAIAAIN